MKDEKKAFEFFLKSAEGGYKPALSMVGYCYKYGVGISKDESKPFELYLKAAKKGDGYSQNLVANYYNNGKYVPKSEEKVFYWNRKAAINVSSEAQHELAEYYSIIRDERKAFKWYLKLADSKYSSAEAIYSVTKCYRDGIGTDKNLDEATKWFKELKGKPTITLNDV